MQAKRCPRCLNEEQAFNAPLGKVIRNPYAKQGSPVWDDCKACQGTGYVSTIVVNAIVQAFPDKAEKILSELRWSMDHFSFNLHGMYVGIELDGYIHS
jgi:hypothetical protein